MKYFVCLSLICCLLTLEAFAQAPLPPAKVIKGTVVEVGHPRAGATVQLRSSNGKLYQFGLGTLNNRALPNTLIRAWENTLNKLKPGDLITIEYTELNAYPDITYGAATRVHVNASSTPSSSITSKHPIAPRGEAGDPLRGDGFAVFYANFKRAVLSNHRPSVRNMMSPVFLWALGDEESPEQALRGMGSRQWQQLRVAVNRFPARCKQPCLGNSGYRLDGRQLGELVFAEENGKWIWKGLLND
jgi:hypothetical protein